MTPGESLPPTIDPADNVAQAKDQAVSAQLNNIGIKSVRVPGKLIVEDLKAAADLVTAALNT